MARTSNVKFYRGTDGAVYSCSVEAAQRACNQIHEGKDPGNPGNRLGHGDILPSLGDALKAHGPLTGQYAARLEEMRSKKPSKK